MVERDVDKCIAQFMEFYSLLMASAPDGYIPWFFPCQPGGKDPAGEVLVAIDPSNTKRSWHHKSARLTKEQCIELIQRGYNIGISARESDALVIIDIDNPEFLSQAPSNTLTVTSRKRCGLHAFCWAADSSVKINVTSSSNGEIRSNNEYVLSCGSYVAFRLEKPDDLTDEKAMKAWNKEKAAFDKIGAACQADEWLGYYTVKNPESPRAITYDEFPNIFKKIAVDNKASSEWVKLRSEYKSGYSGKYDELGQLKMRDIIGDVKGRVGHPLHESDTDANFSLGDGGLLAHCWRHLVSLNPVQFLCVKAGYATCENAGTPHKGNGVSKIKGDKAALEAAYQQAVMDGLIRAKPEPTIESSRPRVRLPEGLASPVSRTVGTFAREISQILSSKNQLFFNIALKRTVEIRWMKDKLGSGISYLGFAALTGDRFITLVEKDVVVYKTIRTQIKNEEGEIIKTKIEDVEKNMTLNQANITIVSDQFMSELPKIKRIFTAPIPILHDGQLTFPTKGYDPRFESWLDPSSPEIAEVSYEEASVIIDYIFAEFCFKDMKQDKTHAIAALLTPFLRGLFPAFNNRTPLFIYLANRERAGKDFCAGVTGLVYEGVAREDTPLSESGDGKFTNSNKSDELRKKICSAMITGRKRMHFSNCKGHLDNTILESIITNKTFGDRLLGKNEEIFVDNEMDFSLSGNLGISYTPDVEQRSRVIHFMLNIEDPNSRRFINPDLHGWVLTNRNKILGAMYALVKRWYGAGMPQGQTPFASFPEWARVCGGVMIVNGLGDPCKGQTSLVVGGNSVDRDMKILWTLGYENFKTNKDGFLKAQLMDMMAGANGWCATEDIFTEYASLCEERAEKQTGARSAFSRLLLNHIGREYGRIKLVQYKQKEERESKQRYIFIKEGDEEYVE